MSTGILCQGCGVEAPTRYAEFHQNIGALVIRFGKSYKGQLCKQCMHKYFWQASLTTLFLGPWGVVSCADRSHQCRRHVMPATLPPLARTFL